MSDFAILERGTFEPEHLHISYDPGLTMPVDPVLLQYMEEQWQEKLRLARQRSVPLYDAPLFRFVHAEVSIDRILQLQLGDTGYKEYVITREPGFAHTHTRQELSNALAVCSVVETSDGYILLDKRDGVDVYEGWYHVIGGFCERGIDAGQSNSLDPFAAMRREIREETGILAEDISLQLCLGLVYDLLTPHTELCFVTQLYIPLATVMTRTPLDGEIKRLHTLSVTAEGLRTFLSEHEGSISATGHPNLLLYGSWKFGGEWFNPATKID